MGTKTEAAERIAQDVRVSARRKGRPVTALDVDEARSWYISYVNNPKLYKTAEQRKIPATRTIWTAIRRQEAELSN